MSVAQDEAKLQRLSGPRRGRPNELREVDKPVLLPTARPLVIVVDTLAEFDMLN